MSSDVRGKGCLVILHTFVSARAAFKQCWYLISKFRNFEWQCSREMAHRLVSVQNRSTTTTSIYAVAMTSGFCTTYFILKV